MVHDDFRHGRSTASHDMAIHGTAIHGTATHGTAIYGHSRYGLALIYCADSTRDSV